MNDVALFVTDQDEADAGVEQGVHEVDVLLAGDTEDVLDAFVLQAADDQVGDRRVRRRIQGSIPFNETKRPEGGKTAS